MECASGVATDIPDLIRQAASDDEGEVREAVEQLGYELSNDGVLWPAVQPAVPLLIELVEGGRARRSTHVLRMLARLVPPPGERDLRAEAVWGYAGPPVRVNPLGPVVRGLLGEHLPTLLRLLSGDDPATRAAVARLLAGLVRHAAAIIPPLTRAADREHDPPAHASMLLAVGALTRDVAADATDTRRWLGERLTDAYDPLTRTAAAVASAWLRADAQRLRPTLQAAARQLPAGLDDAFEWAECGPDPFLRSAFPDDCPYALDLVRAGVQSSEPSRRYEAVSAGNEVMRVWRHAPAQVVGILADLAHDPSVRVRQHAVQSLALAGQATATVSDLLVALLDDRRPAEDTDTWPAVSASARYGLARRGDSRCLPAVRHALFAPEHVPWLAESLAGLVAYADALLPDVGWLLMSGRDHGRLAAVISGIETWGARVGCLAEELFALTGDAQWSAWPGGLPGVLGSLGGRGAPAVPYLRSLLRHHLAPVRASAAVALWRITGDNADTIPILRTIVAERQPGAAELVADAVEPLGAAAAPLAPGFADLLDRPERRTRVAAGRALWSITRDADRVRAALVASAGPDEPGVRAIEVLAQIGPSAAEVLPVLRPMAFSERRIPKCTGDLCVIRDESYQGLARVALARIAPDEGP